MTVKCDKERQRKREREREKGIERERERERGRERDYPGRLGTKYNNITIYVNVFLSNLERLAGAGF